MGKTSRSWHLTVCRSVLGTGFGLSGFFKKVSMARPVALDEGQSETQGRQSTLESPSSLPAWQDERQLRGMLQGIEVLLTTKEASQVLKIHPKVLERMAKRGEVPALKVGKFWRYRATALDAWINSRLQSGCQPCRMKTSF